MGELEDLHRIEDNLADNVETCETCHLPKMNATYVLGLELLRKQLSDLKTDLQRMVDKIDTLDHNRNIR